MIPFAFFGSSHFSVIVLDELSKLGFIPSIIITTPDKPQGRHLTITPNTVKVWAQQKNIPVYTPAKLDQSFVDNLRKHNLDIYIVASYGKILPKNVIELPPKGTLNIHPSLLPQYRGASPLQSAILDDTKQTGVSIMKIDEEMDHGPVIAQKNITVSEWPAYETFETMMATQGAHLLASTITDWVQGKIQEREQNHHEATYTKKLKKEDALLDLASDPYVIFRKIQAYHEWPNAYFCIEKNGKKMRIKVTAASFNNNILTIEKVIPEGGREMGYSDFVRGYGDPFMNAQSDR